ncbi:MAG TPA: hypothetical protein PLP63_06395 [Saprospiraceae bacterium]|nr:hypothetical protein [Saprospiraceae bacterium]
MAEKRLFEVLDEMNRLDIEKNTQTLKIANAFVESKLTKQGTLITMGAPADISIDLLNNKSMVLLLIIDKEAYNKLK